MNERDEVVFFNLDEKDEKKRLIDEFYYSLEDLEDLRMVYYSNYDLNICVKKIKVEYTKEKRNYDKIEKMLNIINKNGIEIINNRKAMEIDIHDIKFKQVIYKINKILIKIKDIDRNYNDLKNTMGNSEKKSVTTFPYNTFNDNEEKVGSFRAEIIDNDKVIDRTLKNQLQRTSNFEKSKNTRVLPDPHELTNNEKLKNNRILSEPHDLIKNENHANTEKPKEIYLISHSNIDAESCEKIAFFLEDIGVSKDNIRCTSLTGYDVPLGNDFLEFIKDSFKYDITVIYIISENYFNSRYCLNEMGATWITESEHFTVNLDKCKIENCVLPSTEKYVEFNSEGFARIYEFLKNKNKIESKDYTELNRLIKRNIK